jgi:hypothetical protein
LDAVIYEALVALFDQDAVPNNDAVIELALIGNPKVTNLLDTLVDLIVVDTFAIL